MNSSVGSLQNINTAKSVDFKTRMVRVRSCAASLSCLGLSSIHPSKKDGSTGSLISIYDDQSVSSLDELSENEIGSSVTSRLTGKDDSDYLTCYQWYAGKISRLEAEQRLEGVKDGTYLIRKSENRMDYTHAIAVKWNNQSFHIRLYRSGGKYSVANFRSATFSSVEELVAYFQDHSLLESFPNIKTALKYPFGEITRFEDADTDASDDYVDDVCSSNEENETVYQSVVDPDVPLIEQEWYHGKLSRNEAEQLLFNQPDFSFLLRDSESVQGSYSLTIRDESSHGFIHLRITKQKNGYVLGQYSQPFTSLSEMIAFFCQHKLNIKGITHRRLQFPLPR